MKLIQSEKLQFKSCHSASHWFGRCDKVKTIKLKIVTGSVGYLVVLLNIFVSQGLLTYFLVSVRLLLFFKLLLIILLLEKR